jgi:hypothetical protein
LTPDEHEAGFAQAIAVGVVELEPVAVTLADVLGAVRLGARVPWITAVELTEAHRAAEVLDPLLLHPSARSPGRGFDRELARRRVGDVRTWRANSTTAACMP